MAARVGAEHYGAERAETVLPVKWIAERLHMGAPGYVSLLLYRQRKGI